MSHILIINRKLRNAARFFYWIKCHTDLSRGFLPEDIPQSVFFSRYEKKSAIDLLLSEKWIGKSADGRLFLRGRKFFHNIFSQKKTAAYAAIPAAALETKRSWLNFLSGLEISRIGRSVHRTLKPGEKKRNAVCLKDAGLPSNTSVFLALSIVQKRTGLSLSSSSRLRTRGHQSGVVSVTKHAEMIMQVDMSTGELRPLEMDRMELTHYQANADGYFFLKAGVVHQSLPSSVSFQKLLRKKM